MGKLNPDLLVQPIAADAPSGDDLAYDASFLKREWFEGKQAVGVTAGASAPEELVQQVISRLREWGGAPAEELRGREEHVVFSLPRPLRKEMGSGPNS